MYRNNSFVENHWVLNRR